MPQETKAFNSVEEVRDFVSAGGKFLVLDPDTGASRFGLVQKVTNQ
jgi:hypothetical protein